MLESGNPKETKADADDSVIDATPVLEMQGGDGGQRPPATAPVDAADCDGEGEGDLSTGDSQMGKQTAPNPCANDVIRPGAIQKLVVPREDIGEGIVESEELDLADLQTLKIRKPGRREWIALKVESELPTRLLVHKPKPDGMDVQHYFVSPEIRQPIREELKDVRVFLYYSIKAQTHALWIANVTLDNSWYESLQPLFALPPSFFESHEIRVIPDKPASCYRIRHRAKTGDVIWPEQSTSELLGEALGEDRFINDANHPLYRDLIEGDEL